MCTWWVSIAGGWQTSGAECWLVFEPGEGTGVQMRCVASADANGRGAGQESKSGRALILSCPNATELERNAV